MDGWGVGAHALILKCVVPWKERQFPPSWHVRYVEVEDLDVAVDTDDDVIYGELNSTKRVKYLHLFRFGTMCLVGKYHQRKLVPILHSGDWVAIRLSAVARICCPFPLCFRCAQNSTPNDNHIGLFSDFFFFMSICVSCLDFVGTRCHFGAAN